MAKAMFWTKDQSLVLFSQVVPYMNTVLVANLCTKLFFPIDPVITTPSKAPETPQTRESPRSTKKIVETPTSSKKVFLSMF